MRRSDRNFTAKNLEKQSTTISSSGDLKLTKISKTLLPVMDI